jgi:xanthine dehydrogenase accessory factor
MSDPESRVSPDEVVTAIQLVFERGEIAALATLVDGAVAVGKKLLLRGSGETTGSFGDDQLDKAVIQFLQTFLQSREDARTFRVAEFAPSLTQCSDVRVLFERLQPEQRVVICGAGHVGASLARLAALLGYSVTLIDDRAEFVARDRFPDERINLVAAHGWATSVQLAVGNGHGVAVAVVTRGHNEDEECLRAIISSEADYVGLIGSKRRTNIVLERLREAGADELKLKNVRAPIGLDLGAVTPEEVALAILAEMVAERRGGTGTSLSAWRRK